MNYLEPVKRESKRAQDSLDAPTKTAASNQARTRPVLLICVWLLAIFLIPKLRSFVFTYAIPTAGVPNETLIAFYDLIDEVSTLLSMAAFWWLAFLTRHSWKSLAFPQLVVGFIWLYPIALLTYRLFTQPDSDLLDGSFLALQLDILSLMTIYFTWSAALLAIFSRCTGLHLRREDEAEETPHLLTVKSLLLLTIIVAVASATRQFFQDEEGWFSGRESESTALLATILYEAVLLLNWGIISFAFTRCRLWQRLTLIGAALATNSALQLGLDIWDYSGAGEDGLVPIESTLAFVLLRNTTFVVVTTLVIWFTGFCGYRIASARRKSPAEAGSGVSSRKEPFEFSESD